MAMAMSLIERWQQRRRKPECSGHGNGSPSFSSIESSLAVWVVFESVRDSCESVLNQKILEFEF
ncbi:hypothetical protein SDJN02_09774, partial [Cucurbita argyrosperma subsp. argyrosperma]